MWLPFGRLDVLDELREVVVLPSVGREGQATVTAHLLAPDLGGSIDLSATQVLGQHLSGVASHEA